MFRQSLYFLSLTKGWRRVSKGRCGKLLGPDQFLLAVQPLLKKNFDLTGPTLLLIGNETKGLSSSWRELADHMVRIPMAGSASSLNAANAAPAVLYEVARQRIARSRRST